MSEIFNIVLPIFGLLGVGYLAAWSGLMDGATTDGFSAYVQRIAVPVLVFRAIALTPVPDIAPVTLIACYFGAVAVVWACGSLIARHGLQSDPQVSAIAGVGSAYSNSVMLGLPLVLSSYGDKGLLIFFVLFPFHLPLMTFANAIQIELSRGHKIHFGKAIVTTVEGMARNPIIIGVLTGAIFRFSGLMLTHSADTVLNMIAGTAIPCALVSMGMILRRYGLVKGIRPAMLMTVLKLVVLPALVWLFTARFAGLDPVTVGVLTIFAASPVGINAYIFAARYGVGIAEASSAIALSTGLSIFTISAVLLFLGVG